MSGLTLTLRQTPTTRVDAAPLRFAPGSNADDFARRTVRTEDGQMLRLEELFTIAHRNDDEFHINGDLSLFDGLGSRMTTGSLFLHGNVGHRTGEDISGGRITITGNVGNDTGSHMSDGAIVIRGNTGQRTGGARPGATRGMTGGDIIIFGNAGNQTGALLRRGIIAVSGSLGDEPLRAALAGTVLSLGDVGNNPARFNKRASLITFGKITPPPTYRHACTYRPTFVRVLLKHLQTNYKFPVEIHHLEQQFERACGDLAEGGRGEILHPPI